MVEKISKKFDFTEKTIDEFFENHFLTIDQMMFLREAYDIWRIALFKARGARKRK